MKPKKDVLYFPVSISEHELLLRVRMPDLIDRADDLVDMVDQIARERLTPAELDQAIQAYVESRKGEGLDARFDNLEGRLKERIEKGLAEIEGRLSKRQPGAAPASESPTPEDKSSATHSAAQAGPAASAQNADGSVPREASLAFRIGPDLVWGPSAAQFYVAVWRWLFEHGHVTHADMPIQGGKSRYAVASSPVHPSGKRFTRSEEAVPGAFVELNMSRADIIRRAKKYLSLYGVAYSVAVGPEGS